MISIIAAVADNRAIGKKNSLLWHISEDLKYFKKVTNGHAVIMGRKTYDSIGRPLPGRRNIVVSKSALAFPEIPAFKKDGTPNNTSIEQAKDLDGLLASLSRKRKEEFFVIGGGSIYAAALQYAKRLYITRVYAKAEGADAFFPVIDEKEWVVTETSDILTDEENNIKFQFIVYERKRLKKQQ